MRLESRLAVNGLGALELGVDLVNDALSEGLDAGRDFGDDGLAESVGVLAGSGEVRGGNEGHAGLVELRLVSG